MTSRPKPPPIRWEGKIGPSFVLVIAGIFIQTIVVIWVASGTYTGLTKTIELQGAKIDTVEKGSDKRFEAVRDSIKNAADARIVEQNRMTAVETTMGFIKDSVQRLEARIIKP